MDRKTLEEVSTLVDRGGILTLQRSETGKRKVIVRSGPFGIVRHSFPTDYRTFEAIKEKYQLRRR